MGPISNYSSLRDKYLKDFFMFNRGDWYCSDEEIKKELWLQLFKKIIEILFDFLEKKLGIVYHTEKTKEQNDIFNIIWSAHINFCRFSETKLDNLIQNFYDFLDKIHFDKSTIKSEIDGLIVELNSQLEKELAVEILKEAERINYLREITMNDIIDDEATLKSDNPIFLCTDGLPLDEMEDDSHLLLDINNVKYSIAMFWLRSEIFLIKKESSFNEIYFAAIALIIVSPISAGEYTT